MKGRQKAHNTQNQPNKKQTSALADKEKTTNAQEKTTCDKKYHKIVIENKEERRSYKEPIVVATLILATTTFMLFVATGFLYWEASQAGNDAKRAADIAKESLGEYKREFEANNRPDISLFDFKVFDIPNTNFMKCTFKIINTGRLRAKINYIHLVHHLGTDTAHYSASDTMLEIPFNQYMQFNAAYNPEDIFNFVNGQQKDDFITGKKFVFLDFNYEYHNEAINKDYLVHFLVKLFYSNGILGTIAIDFNETENEFK